MKTYRVPVTDWTSSHEKPVHTPPRGRQDCISTCRGISNLPRIPKAGSGRASLVRRRPGPSASADWAARSPPGGRDIRGAAVTAARGTWDSGALGTASSTSLSLQVTLAHGVLLPDRVPRDAEGSSQLPNRASTSLVLLQEGHPGSRPQAAPPEWAGCPLLRPSVAHTSGLCSGPALSFSSTPKSAL